LQNRTWLAQGAKVPTNSYLTYRGNKKQHKKKKKKNKKERSALPSVTSQGDITSHHIPSHPVTSRHIPSRPIISRPPPIEPHHSWHSRLTNNSAFSRTAKFSLAERKKGKNKT
jgi:hypothetical protein